jgi:hypothetical protein
MNSDDTAVMAQIAVIVVCTLTAFTGLAIAVHAYLRRARRHAVPAVAPTLAPAADKRLERLEHAVDAIALEVERISEGQRFLTRLHTERQVERVLGE